MSEPRHISVCIDEWLDEYPHTTAAREDKPKREPRDPAEVVAEHTSQPEEKTA